jgi:hypothetical protein
LTSFTSLFLLTPPLLRKQHHLLSFPLGFLFSDGLAVLSSLNFSLFRSVKLSTGFSSLNGLDFAFDIGL